MNEALIYWGMGGIGLFLHLLFKWQAAKLSLKAWVGSRETRIYLVASILLFLASMMLSEEMVDVGGYGPRFYALLMGYSGGSVVRNLMDVRAANDKPNEQNG